MVFITVTTAKTSNNDCVLWSCEREGLFKAVSDHTNPVSTFCGFWCGLPQVQCDTSDLVQKIADNQKRKHEFQVQCRVRRLNFAL